MLTNQIEELRRLAHQLLYPGTEDAPIYADSLARMNKEVAQKTDALFTAQASTDEEEGMLCLALLMGCNAVLYGDGDTEARKQAVLDRAWKVLEKLPPSLMKCRLLTYCYGEVYDAELAAEAHEIIDSWGKEKLNEEEQEILDTLVNMEKYPYPCTEIKE